MLTRLKVSGFKNLIDVDVSFGPFTCIAGTNGVGKSNLFDAITFLAALADKPLAEAAQGIRDEHNRSTDIRSIFFNVQNVMADDRVRFEAEMLVPREGADDLGQRAVATTTFLRYTLELGYRQDPNQQRSELFVQKEELNHITSSKAKDHLKFPHTAEWQKSVVTGRRSGKAFISTTEEGSTRKIKLHQDKGVGGKNRGGRTWEILADSLPRTVLSTVNAVESPTALLARREMQSWRLLQLEPSALRMPDSFNAPTHIGADGSHLAATLHYLARAHQRNGNGAGDEDAIYCQVANRLANLSDEVKAVEIDIDNRRELKTLCVVDRNGSHHAARALSDGTLRFLALAILEMDSNAHGLLCFEEPENGIHPQRIAAMLRLLKDLAVDPECEIGIDNPLRQVIVNTHSPSVVANVDEGDLLVAVPKEIPHTIEGRPSRCRAVEFSGLAGTWRHKAELIARPISLGQLQAYLDPIQLHAGQDTEVGEESATTSDVADNASGSAAKPGLTPAASRRRRVKDRDDVRQMFLRLTDSE
ncbi:MAG: AAA family ATPase [Planctomycetota bacterium]